MLINLFLIAAGIAVLIAAAEALVRGAVSISAKFGVPPLVIGLTVVSFGTSAPELTVNIASALNDSPGLAIGNVVGSNIANILLILGVSALIRPLSVKSSTVWKEIPLALLGVVLLFVMGNDILFDGATANAISRTDGIVLISLMAIFMYYIVSLARAEKTTEEESMTMYPIVPSIIMIIAGLGGLVLGGQMLVSNAVAVATTAGLSEALIGLTIIGIGTSLPELATAVVATRKGHTDIAIGNVVGSNIFNVFWILGLTGTILQLPFDSTVSVDVLVSVAATLLLFGFMFLGKKHHLTKTEGVIFLTMYAGYLGFLIQRG